MHKTFISGLQQVKQTLSLNSTYLIYSWHQVSYFVFHQTILSFWTKFAQKENFQSKTEKVNITTKFSIFALVSDAKFHLKQIILFFCTKFAQKGYFPFKAGQMNFTTKFRILVLVEVPNFTLNRQLWFFKSKKNFHYKIQHIRITLHTKFHLKQTVLIFWTKCAQKGHFQSKEGQRDITTEFSIFRLVEDLSRFITKVYLDLSWTNNFDFFDHICPKRIFPIQNRKKEYQHRVQHIWISQHVMFLLKQTILIFLNKFA